MYQAHGWWFPDQDTHFANMLKKSINKGLGAVYQQAARHKSLELVKHKGLALDIGANVGLFTNYISLKKNVKLIHAIEPVSKPFEELKKQFYYYHGVKCHKLGIHYNTGKIKMTVNSRETILSTFINNSHFEYEEVDVCTLPDFLNKNNLATVDLIKLDVEGLEYEILNSLTFPNLC